MTEVFTEYSFEFKLLREGESNQRIARITVHIEYVPSTAPLAASYCRELRNYVVSNWDGSRDIQATHIAELAETLLGVARVIASAPYVHVQCVTVQESTELGASAYNHR